MKAWVHIVNKGGRKIQAGGIGILPDGEVVIEESKFSAAHVVEPAASFDVKIPTAVGEAGDDLHQSVDQVL
jgi:hypothetical protein